MALASPAAFFFFLFRFFFETVSKIACRFGYRCVTVGRTHRSQSQAAEVEVVGKGGGGGRRYSQ